MIALKMKIRHADMTVGPGNFRHPIVNMDRNIVHMPLMTFYWLLLIWTAFSVRAWSMIDWAHVPSTLPLLYVVYLLVTVVSNLKVVSPWMLAFPLYALVQSLVMPSFGMYTYARLAYRRRTLGRYRFGYRRAARVVPVPAT